MKLIDLMWLTHVGSAPEALQFYNQPRTRTKPFKISSLEYSTSNFFRHNSILNFYRLSFWLIEGAQFLFGL